MEHGVPLLLLLVLVPVVSPWLQAGASDAGSGGRGPRRVPAVLAFGASFVDTGNNNAIVTAARADFRPYGQDLNGGVPTGRFCNGRLVTDLLASRLGVKDLVPAYLGTDLTADDLLNSHACGSADAGGAEHVRGVQGEARRDSRRGGRRQDRRRQPVRPSCRHQRHLQQLLPGPRQVTPVRHLGVRRFPNQPGF